MQGSTDAADLHVLQSAAFQREQTQLLLAARLVVLVGHLAQRAQRVKHLKKGEEDRTVQPARERAMRWEQRAGPTLPALHFALTNAYLRVALRRRRRTVQGRLKGGGGGG